MRAKLSIALASVLVSALGVTAPADAACKKFGFTVNDYGKDGPTNDAKNLLDKHIAEWAAQNGVTAYQTGKKTVSCELFLDVILFDEHTCTASASVCWGAGVKPNNGTGEQAAATDDAAAGNGEAPPHPVRKADALGIAPQAQQAAAVAPAAPAPADTAGAVDAAPTTPVEQIAAPAETPAASPAVHTPAAAVATPPAATPSATAAVETGALQASQPVPGLRRRPRRVPPKKIVPPLLPLRPPPPQLPSAPRRRPKRPPTPPRKLPLPLSLRARRARARLRCPRSIMPPAPSPHTPSDQSASARTVKTIDARASDAGVFFCVGDLAEPQPVALVGEQHDAAEGSEERAERGGAGDKEHDQHLVLGGADRDRRRR